MTIISALWLCLAWGPQGAPDEAKVRELLERLDSDDVSVRNQAQEELAAMGEGVVPLLEKAKAGAAAEVRSRIETIVADVTLAPKWAKELIDEQTMGEAFGRLEQGVRGKTVDRKQAARIISIVLRSERASENVRQTLFAFVERHRFTELWPVLIELAVRDDGDNNYALGYLQRMRPPPEAADEMLKAVPRIRGRSGALQLLQAAAALKPEKSKVDAAIRALLEGDLDESTRSSVLSSISGGRLPASLRTLVGAWRSSKGNRSYQTYLREAFLRAAPDEAVKEVLEWLSAGDVEDLLIAADYAGRHKIAEAMGPLLEAFHRQSEEKPAGPFDAFARQAYDPRPPKARLAQVLRTFSPESRVKEWLSGAAGAPPKTALVFAAGELDLKAVTPEIEAMLGDRDPGVRREAARALGALKAEGSAASLAERLKDESLPVRRAALHAIVRIRGAAATPVVLEQLHSDHPDARAAALEVLPQMEADAVIEDLTKDANLARGTMRYALAVYLVHQGEPALHRVMTRVADKLSSDDLQALTRLIQAARGWK